MCVLDSYANFYDAQPSTYRYIRWAIFFTEALLKDDDFREIKLL